MPSYIDDQVIAETPWERVPPGLVFVPVPEGKTVKNRLHIDIHSDPGGLDKLVARLEELGATRVREVEKGPAGHWWVMQDPEGNEFCAA